ncbi:hypothetical protein FRC03_009761 [Tulasnella sp. 419]|nr:hypothetical protein FRC03_009761 [Tulasnella sp. 419]
MPPKRPICRTHIHNTNGCTKGNQCTLRHVGPAGAGAKPSGNSSRPSPSTNPPGSAKGPRSRGPAQNSNARVGFQRPAGLPYGACKDFWEKGSCSRGPFDCKYQHIDRSDNQTTNRNGIISSRSDFLTPQGLEDVAESSTDVFTALQQHMSPTEAHNHMTKFLRPDYQFRTAQDIYSFVKVLVSANEKHEDWDLMDGQSFLIKMAEPQGTGLLRIRDVLRFEPVSSNAGRSKNTLSFQRGFVRVLMFFSSSFVIRSALDHLINSLYSLIDENFDNIVKALNECMPSLMGSHSFVEQADPTNGTLSGTEIFSTLTAVFYAYATRFKQAVASKPTFVSIVQSLEDWFTTWSNLVMKDPSPFTDSVTKADLRSRKWLIDQLSRELRNLRRAVDHAEGGTFRRVSRPAFGAGIGGSRDEALLNSLQYTYDGPGAEHRLNPADGIRHDNDRVNISDIRIAPTYDEMLSTAPNYLPANVPGARHHLPSDSMERVLDIQFRLLREELTCPIKSAIYTILDELKQPRGKRTQFLELIGKKGGLYKPDRHSQESVMFSVYTGVTFTSLECHSRAGIFSTIIFDTPAGRAREGGPAQRAQYWESVGKRRLMQGGLVALLWIEGDEIKVYLGVVTSRMEDLIRSSRESPTKLRLGVSFFDSEVDARILQALQSPYPAPGQRYLIEAPILLESIRPFLETLQTVVPSDIPFSKYLTHPLSGRLDNIDVDPPVYTTMPNFAFKLDCLFPGNKKPLRLSPTSEVSKIAACEALKIGSRLDPSQADATIRALSSCVSLIQGPPGTGKSYTGVELLRVLIENKIGPILLIAFTNHALDHLLQNVLHAGITDQIVRIGSRSAEEDIAALSLEKILSNRTQLGMRKAIGRDYRQLKAVEESLMALMRKVTSRRINPLTLRHYLETKFRNHLEELTRQQSWIHALYEDYLTWEHPQGKSKKPRKRDEFDFWLEGQDITFIQNAHRETSGNHSQNVNGISQLTNRFAGLEVDDNASTSDDSLVSGQDDKASSEDDQSPLSFLKRHGLLEIPPIPSGKRKLDELEADFKVWNMSRGERQALYYSWGEIVKRSERDDQLKQFEQLREEHATAKRILQEADNQDKVQILRNAHIIGCTTNGAAKLTALLKSVRPKVLLVEEAGQVLEAHTLASLVSSIQQMILIGDPQQLRPTLANYHLSADNPRTGRIYRFDQSLMERLWTMGFPMSRLDVQRRMRPSVSNLIRQTLYPTLIDHETVQSYPDVRGMAENVFFLDHRHAEDGGGDESASKTNKYEVSMIKDLVLYFLRQGCYSGERDIIVLCAYLGQLSLIKKALSKEVITVIDERDAAQLVDHEENADPSSLISPDVATEMVNVSKRVVIRTVDNFQGEEGTIVILSLVRNSGMDSQRRRPSIGFLKSENRANVALSRARHGLYILGNSEDLSAQSPMWAEVVEELRRNDQIGDGFTICCQRHPATSQKITQPGQIAQVAPDGGCRLPCEAQLRCGHHCPYKCHSDDEHHLLVKCPKPCQRTCQRLHPCPKGCSQACDNCLFRLKITLNCGHENNVECWRLDDVGSIRCDKLVQKRLPGCEHFATMRCSQDPALYACKSTCGLEMSCCQETCKSRCHECQAVNRSKQAGSVAYLTRSRHSSHRCNKPLHCSHPCPDPCSTDHSCVNSLCKMECHQKCHHQHCAQPCSTPCAPCMEACVWNCDHHKCIVICGSPCARLPCDQRCLREMKCGHRCPSVCGEDCTNQTCPQCADESRRSRIVNTITGTTLGEIRVDAESLDELLITLACGHIYTVELLDEICDLSRYYGTDDYGRWQNLAQPPLKSSDSQNLPVCPGCGALITVRRYGRVFKRANLRISEQNFSKDVVRSLAAVQTSFNSLDINKIRTWVVNSVNELPEDEMKIESSPHPPSRITKIRQKLLDDTTTSPVKLNAFQQLDRIHGLPRKLAQAWKQTAEQLLNAYESSLTAATKRSPGSVVHDAAFAALYGHYIDALHERRLVPPEPISFEKYAAKMADLACGIVPSEDDQWLLVEAIWMSIRVRTLLANIAGIWTEQLKEIYFSKSPGVIDCWLDFVDFIYESMRHDALIALRIATESKSAVQVAKSSLLSLQSELDIFVHRFRREELSSLTTPRRSELYQTAKQHASKAEKKLTQLASELQDQPGTDNSQHRWLTQNFGSVAKCLVEEWNSVVGKLRWGGELVLEGKRDSIDAIMAIKGDRFRI